MIYRQGDVLLVSVESIPRGAHVIEHTGAAVVLAEGEVTGHHHAIAVEDGIDVALFGVADDVDRWLRVRSRAVELRHQEHATITLPPGDYKVVRQREYSPEEIRRVAD